MLKTHQQADLSNYVDKYMVIFVLINVYQCMVVGVYDIGECRMICKHFCKLMYQAQEIRKRFRAGKLSKEQRLGFTKKCRKIFTVWFTLTRFFRYFFYHERNG